MISIYLSPPSTVGPLDAPGNPLVYKVPHGIAAYPGIWGLELKWGRGGGERPSLLQSEGREKLLMYCRVKEE
jgi:hypothetical protein